MSEKKGFNRRDFLKIVGASTGVAASGCAQELPEKLIPYVVQPDEVVPGVASWYAASCGECSAGCGVLVRTREGRVVKVEGNPSHPVNKGGLCAVGQSSVQGLYDPDRVREPLKREVNGAFKPISWKEAIDEIAGAIAKASSAGKETVLLTKPLAGSITSLTEEFVKNVQGASHIEYDLFDDAAGKSAAEISFGPGTEVSYEFEGVKTIVNFGADFLETWKSPVEFTKGFTKGRVPGKDGTISRLIQFEPRLSLTAANADSWIKNAPGSEHKILRALLALVYKKAGAKNLQGSASVVDQILSGSSVEADLKGTGVTAEKLQNIATELVDSPSSLVLSGGSAVGGEQEVYCGVLANALNAVLGNLGSSVLLRNGKAKTAAAPAQLRELTTRLASEERPVGVLFVSGANPVFTLPANSGFSKAAGKAGLVVALSTNLDETSRMAQIVLPKSTSFETWSDSEPSPGLFNLNQPSMQPLYPTQSLGDTLLAIAASEKLNKPIGDAVGFVDYIKSQWKARTGEGGFETRWLEYVQAGGEWSTYKNKRGGAKSLLASAAKVSAPSDSVKGLSMLSYPTVHFADGSVANRPWMQETPDPMTTIVWGSWIEIHPDTAAKVGVSQGDVVQLATPQGEIEAPAFVTKHIHPDLVALPIGQGHQGLGRYASGIGVNPLALSPTTDSGPLTHRLFSKIKLSPSVSKETMVVSQGHDVQYERGITRTVSLAALAGADGHGENHGHAKKAENGHGEGHGDHHVPEDFHLAHHDPNALGPHPEPKQMYKQMPHVQYSWGMSIDLASCTGCSACVTACYAENNIPTVGKEFCKQGREMSWIRVQRFFEDDDHEQPVTGFQPMMCQHCGNAPCEPVCPVYATYHSDEGLNTMVYNRCVGTRYCSNNCSYKVRRFNWFNYELPEPMNWQLNPDVTTRSVGVMEKCSFCIQRIKEGTNAAKDAGREVQDGEIQPACAASCPADAITFGNLNDPESAVYQNSQSKRGYKVLDSHLNTQPAITYLAKVVHEDGQKKEHG